MCYFNKEETSILRRNIPKGPYPWQPNSHDSSFPSWTFPTPPLTERVNRGWCGAQLQLPDEYPLYPLRPFLTFLPNPYPWNFHTQAVTQLDIPFPLYTQHFQPQSHKHTHIIHIYVFLDKNIGLSQYNSTFLNRILRNVRVYVRFFHHTYYTN